MKIDEIKLIHFLIVETPNLKLLETSIATARYSEFHKTVIDAITVRTKFLRAPIYTILISGKDRDLRTIIAIADRTRGMRVFFSELPIDMKFNYKTSSWEQKGGHRND